MNEPLTKTCSTGATAAAGHLCDDELVLHYYEESGADTYRTATHLEGCSECRERYVRLQRVMAMAQSSAPQPRASFEDELWQRLEPTIARAAGPIPTGTATGAPVGAERRGCSPRGRVVDGRGTGSMAI